MKKLRLMLSVLAIVFAVTATFATQLRATFVVDGWEFVPGTIDQCVKQMNLNCDTNSLNLCTINTHKVGNSSDISTQCGEQYRKP